MASDDIANPVVVTKTNRTDNLTQDAVWIQHHVSTSAAHCSQLLSKSPTDLNRGHICYRILQSSKSNIGVFWMHLYHCRSFQEDLRLLMHRLRAQCFAPESPGSIRKYREAQVRSTSVSGRFAYGFRTNLNLAVEKESVNSVTVESAGFGVSLCHGSCMSWHCALSFYDESIAAASSHVYPVLPDPSLPHGRLSCLSHCSLQTADQVEEADSSW